MQGINASHSVNFNGTYIKRVENPEKLFNRDNLSQNDYLMKDFQSADGILTSFAEKLGDNDTVELSSKQGNLELIINHSDEITKMDIGTDYGVYGRLCRIVKKFYKNL